MVDSAVSLSIGTELDLSGFERDLAALKKQTANIELKLDSKKFLDSVAKLGSQLDPIKAKLCLDKQSFFDQFEELQSEIDCIKVKLCVDDSEMESVISQTYQVAVELQPKGLDIKDGKVSISAETLGLDLDTLEKSVTDNFSDLLGLLEASEKNAAARASAAAAAKPLTDIFTGLLEDVGRDLKKGLSGGIEDRTGVNLESLIRKTIGGGDGTDAQGKKDLDATVKILNQVSDIAKSTKGILGAIGGLDNIGTMPDAVGKIVEETANIVNKTKGSDDVSGELATVKKGIDGTLIRSKAMQGAGRAASGAIQIARGSYGAIKGAENAVLSIDPTGIAKVVKSVITPLAVTAAASQVPGAGMVVGEAVQITQAALAPFANILGGEAIAVLTGAISNVVGGLPVIGGQLEVGLVSVITSAITEAVGSATGIAAAAIVGQGVQSGAGAVMNKIAPSSESRAAMSEAKAQALVARALTGFEKIVQQVSVSQLSGTASVLQPFRPLSGVTDTKQLQGTLDKNINVKGLQDVFKQLNGKSGVGQTRKQLVAAISKQFEEDSAAVKKALAKIKPEGLMKGSSMGTLSRPDFDPTKILKDLQTVNKQSNLFIKRFDSAESYIQKQTADGMAKLINIIDLQLEAIEMVKKQFNPSGKLSRQLGGYESQLKSKSSQLQSRFSNTGADPQLLKTNAIDMDTLRGVGENATRTLVDELKKGEALVEEGGEGVGKALRGGTEEALEIKSPSRVFRRIGENVVKGLQQGIASMRHKAVETMQSLTNEITQAGTPSAAPPSPVPQIELPPVPQKRGMQGRPSNSSTTRSGLSEVENKSVNQVEKAMADIGKAFADIAAKTDNTIGGENIRKDLASAQRRIESSDMSPMAKQYARRQVRRQADRKLDTRSELVSNASTLAGSTLVSFNPGLALEALTTPLTLALTPLVGAFTAAKDTVVNFVSQLNEVLKQITPIAIRFNSISGEQTKSLDKEILERENIVRKLQKVGGKDAEIQAQQQTVATLKGQRESLSPEALMAVPKGLSQEYSIPMIETMSAYSKFVAASTGTALEGQGVEKLFTGISQSVSALGLNAQDAELVFMAFQQMLSKGKVSAEELRQQLAERMPGAVQMFAEALGVSQSKLNDMLQAGAVQSDTALLAVAETMSGRYAGAAKEAGNSIVGANTRIRNALQTSQIAIADMLAPAFTKAANLLVSGLEFFSNRAESIFNLVSNLFADVILTMAVSWAAVWSQMSGTIMTTIAPVLATFQKYMMPFAINIGVDFIDNFYSGLTGKDVMSPLMIIIKGIENMVWATFTAIKSLGEGITSVFADIANYVQTAFGGVFSVMSKLGGTFASLGVPLAELATTFVFVNQTMAFFGVNSMFIQNAAKSMGIFFAQVTTGAGRMRIMEGAIKGVTLGLDSLQIKLSAVTALLFLMFAKSDFKDPLKIELDKTLRTLQEVTEQAMSYGDAIQGVEKKTANISKGFNVTFGISEAMGGQKIMTDDVIRALRGDLGDAANKAAFGFLAVISGGIGLAMTPVPQMMAKAGFGFARQLMNVAGSFGTMLMQGASSRVSSLSAIFEGMGKGMAAMFSKTMKMLSPIFSALGSGMAIAFGRVMQTLTPVFATISKTMGIVFSSIIAKLAPIFAFFGKLFGGSITAGAIAGFGIFIATAVATVVDVLSGGAVRAVLTDLAKRFGLIAINEMQNKQRTKKRQESVTGALDAIKGQFLVEMNPGEIEKQINDAEAKLKSTKPWEWGKQDELKSQIEYLKGQVEGSKLTGKTFTSVLTDEAKMALNEVKNLDNEIANIQKRMTQSGNLSVQAEVSGDQAGMEKYNAEYEALNKQLDQKISARAALAKPYEEMLTLLGNARKALTDELASIETSGDFRPEEIEKINAQISRIDSTIEILERNGAKNLTLLKDNFESSAKAIEKNQKRLGSLIGDIDRLKAMELANIAEAFAAGDITSAQKDIRSSRVELQALQKQLDATNATYQSNLRELENLTSRPTQLLEDDEKSRQAELIASVKEQEMQLYQLRTGLADATVQAKETAESAIASSISEFGNKNLEVIDDESTALKMLGEELDRVTTYSKLLAKEAGVSFSFDTKGLGEYRGYLEAVAGVAAMTGVDLGGYVQELAGFATEQQEIDKLIKSKKPEDRTEGAARQKASTGRQVLSMRDLKSEVETGAIDNQLTATMKALRSMNADVFAADVAIAQSYVTRNQAVINNRKAQIMELYELEAAGFINKQQRVQKEKTLNDEIVAVEENLLDRRATLLDSQVNLIRRKEQADIDAINAGATQAILDGGNSQQIEMQRQKDQSAVLQASSKDRVRVIEESSAANKAALDRGSLSYEDFVNREKGLSDRRTEEMKSAMDSQNQLRSDALSDLDKAREKELLTLEAGLQKKRGVGIDDAQIDDERQTETLRINKAALTQKEALIVEESAAIRQGLMDKTLSYDEFLNREKELADASAAIARERVDIITSENDRELASYQKLIDQLKRIDDIRSQVIDAQVKGQERLSQSTNIYSDALSKQAEFVQAIANIQQQASQASIEEGELAIASLDRQKSAIESVRSLDIFDAEKQKNSQKYQKNLAKIRKEVTGLIKGFGASNFDLSKLGEMDLEQVNQLRKTLDQAQRLGVSGGDLGMDGIGAIEQAMEEKSLAIAEEKANLLQQEQETQRKLLALEIERNKIAAQTQIREAEIAAIRAKNAVVSAQVDAARATTPEEMIQAQLGMQLASEEFQFALAQIDISKQGAVIGDRLAQLQKEGLLGEQSMGVSDSSTSFAGQFPGAKNPFMSSGSNFDFSMDASTQKLADLGESLKGITDFSKYDNLLAQLDQAATPLENQIDIQRQAIKSSDKLTTGIDKLNEKIGSLITTLGRPNISVSGGSSVSDTIEIMRAVN